MVLPKELLARLEVGKGGALYVTETPRGVELSPYDPAFEEEMIAARGDAAPPKRAPAACR